MRIIYFFLGFLEKYFIGKDMKNPCLPVRKQGRKSGQAGGEFLYRHRGQGGEDHAQHRHGHA